MTGEALQDLAKVASYWRIRYRSKVHYPNALTLGSPFSKVAATTMTLPVGIS